MANLPALTPTSFGEALQFAEALAKSTMVPREYQMKPANILVAVQWGAELGLGPLQALQNIAVINGKPSVYGDALLALVRGSPLCEDVIERVEGEGDARTAVCEARRKGSSPVVARFSVQDAKRAALWGKTGPWTQYPLRMLQMRARGFALRDAFPDILRGVISAEEAADHPREMKDVTPSAAVLGELNANLESALDAFAKSGGVEPDQAERDPLLVDARSHTLLGYAEFRKWYLSRIDDVDREALRPHIKELQAASKRADDLAEAADEPSRPQPPAADRPREEDPRIPSPREGEPTDAEVERSQAMIGAVLGPEEIAKLDEGELEVVKPKRGPGGRGWDWTLYADDLIAAAKRVPVDRLGRFRGANSSMFEVLHQSNKDEWTRATQALADYERQNGATDG